MRTEIKLAGVKLNFELTCTPLDAGSGVYVLPGVIVWRDSRFLGLGSHKEHRELGLGASWLWWYVGVNAYYPRAS